MRKIELFTTLLLTFVEATRNNEVRDQNRPTALNFNNPDLLSTALALDVFAATSFCRRRRDSLRSRKDGFGLVLTFNRRAACSPNPCNPILPFGPKFSTVLETPPCKAGARRGCVDATEIDRQLLSPAAFLTLPLSR